MTKRNNKGIMYNGQLLEVDTKLKIIKVYDNGNLVKLIKDVWLGKNGCATKDNMHEGGMKTPFGDYYLGVAFGNENINISYPYIKIDDNSYWVDDVKSKYYNYFVQVGDRKNNVNYPYVVNLLVKDFDSAEHLIDYEKAYRYAVFIEYNCNNLDHEVISGKGSAIFLHCHGTKRYTGGCVAIKEKDMEWVLKFLNYEKRPKIIIK